MPRTRRRRKRPSMRGLSRRIKSLQAPVETQTYDESSGLNCFTTPLVTLMTNAEEVKNTTSAQDVKTLSMHMKGIITVPNAVAGTHCIRMAMVKDTRAFDNNTAPTWLDVFDSNDCYSLRADTTSKLEHSAFKVLKDKTFTIVHDLDAQIDNIIPFNWFFKINSKLYDLTTGYQKGMYYLLCASTMATGECLIKFHRRIRYRDNKQ